MLQLQLPLPNEAALQDSYISYLNFLFVKLHNSVYRVYIVLKTSKQETLVTNLNFYNFKLNGCFEYKMLLGISMGGRGCPHRL